MRSALRRVRLWSSGNRGGSSWRAVYTASSMTNALKNWRTSQARRRDPISTAATLACLRQRKSLKHKRTRQRDSELHTTKPLTVTVAMARKISGLGNTTLWALIKDRRLQAVRIGRRTLITYHSLEALLAPDSGEGRNPRPRDRSPRARKTGDRAQGDT